MRSSAKCHQIYLFFFFLLTGVTGYFHALSMIFHDFNDFQCIYSIFSIFFWHLHKKFGRKPEKFGGQSARYVGPRHQWNSPFTTLSRTYFYILHALRLVPSRVRSMAAAALYPYTSVSKGLLISWQRVLSGKHLVCSCLPIFYFY